MTPAAIGDTAGQPQTCEIRNWQVFTDGFFKGTLYPISDIQELADNFPLVSRYMVPHVGIGHDKAQRLAASIGLPSSGDVTGVRHDGRGNLYLDLKNIPTWLGAQVEAGRYPSGSIELKKDFRPPNDPANPIPGRYLDGIALLGEEQPAVKGCAKPRAVFADGTPVPPCWDPVPVPKGPLSPPQPDHGVHHAACFSDAIGVNAVDPELIAKLKALPSDQLQQLLASVGAPGAPVANNAAVPPVAAGAETPPPQMSDKPKWFADFEKKQEDFAADCNKRFSAYDAKFSEDEKKKEDESQMSAKTFSEAAVDDAIKSFRIQPVDRDLFVKQGVDVMTTKTFGAVSGADAATTWRNSILSRPQLPESQRVPINPKPTVDKDGKPVRSVLTELQRDLLNTEAMRRHGPPAVRTKLLQPSAN